MISGVDKRLQNFFEDLKKEIPQIQFAEGYRTNKKQEEIYWSQRDRKTGELLPGIKPEDVATWARGGQSAHNHRKAFDVDGINLRTDKEKIDSILKRHPEIQWEFYFFRKGGWNDPRHFQIKDWRNNKLIYSGISLVGIIILLLFAYFLYTQFFSKTQKTVSN
ncbi:MAG: D-alanyl-D-alanine carboxypeptidase family protein [Leptospiraceae bacterium]|nr:D-alanyl-D-alanine carboxypeptidase family protein [Leptospiraceae bacterium]